MKLRDVPCKCGFRFDTFHICVDLSKPEPAPPPEKKKRSVSNSTRYETERGTDVWKSKIYAATADFREQEKRRQDRQMMELADLFKYGYSRPEMVEIYGIARVTVNKYLQRAAREGLIVLKRPGSKPIPGVAERNEKILQMYRDGQSIRDIAETVGIRYANCAHILYVARDNGEIVLRDRGLKSKPLLIAEYQRTGSIKLAAEKYNILYRTAQKIIQKAKDAGEI